MTDQHRHYLELHGYNDLLAEHCELVDRVAALTERIAELEAAFARISADYRRLHVQDIGSRHPGAHRCPTLRPSSPTAAPAPAAWC